MKSNEVAFTSRKCPAGPDRSCNLPFGFVWTPFSGSSDTTLEGAVPQCLKCLSYLNLYCEINEQNQWICPFCGFQNIVDNDVDPLVTAQPQLEVTQPLTNNNQRRNVLIVLDAHLNVSEVTSIRNTIRNMLKNDQQVQLGLIIFDRSVHMFSMSSDGCAAHIYATSVGFCDSADEKAQYLRSMRSSKDWDVFSNCLRAFYGEAKEQQDPNRPKSRLEMLKERKQARMNEQQQPEMPKSPWIQSQSQKRDFQSRCTGEAINCAIEMASVAEPRTARILVFTNGAINVGVGTTCLENSLRVDSAQLADSIPDFWSPLGSQAANAGIGIDAFLTGVQELAVPAWTSIVEPTGGYVVCHDNVANLEDNIKYVMNETYLSGLYIDDDQDKNWSDGCIVDIRLSSFVEATHLVGLGEFVDDEKVLLPNERASFAAGSALAAKHGIETRKLPDRDSFESMVTRVRICRYDPLTTLSMMLRVLPDIDADAEFAYFQFVARFMNASGTEMITRISTNRLGLAKDVSTYLDSVDEDVIPVVLAKEAVYRSLYGRESEGEPNEEPVDPVQMEKLAYEVQKDIDATIQNISGEFRLLGLQEGTRALDLTEEGQTRAVGSSMDFTFPPELSESLRLLYYLRRGPLVSPGPVQSSDDRAEKRSLFLRLPLEDCLSMMAPTVWTTGGLQDPNLVADVSLRGTAPPETLVLWDNSIIAADHFNNLFVWSGKSTLNKDFDHIRLKFRKLLEERAEHRFPRPMLHILQENDSMSRRFTSLLAPSHSDPVEHQLAHFPALANLTPDEVFSLRSKFRFHDPAVDPSFHQWFWDIASATSISNRKRDQAGISLCE